MRYNWFGIKAKERTCKTGAVWVTTYPPLSLRENMLSGPWIIDFDSFITEEE